MSKRYQKNLIFSDYKPSAFDVEEIVESFENQGNKEGNYDDLYNLKKELEDKIANIDALEREAYERGYSVGENAGFQMGLQKAEMMVEKLQGLIKELENLKENYIKTNHKKILALSFAIAKKIIEKEVSNDENLMLNILNNALKKIERREKITITINPSIQLIVEKFKLSIKDICPKVIINVDPNVDKYFIKLESDTEEIMIDFNQELYEISKKLSELI